MNLALRLRLQNHLDNGEVTEFLVNEENYLKAIKVIPESVFVNAYLKDDVVYYQISTKDLIENDVYHFFDLLDGTNHLVFNIEAYLKPMCNDRKFNFLEKWEYGKDKKRVVISHKNCQDGAGVTNVIRYHKDIILESENNVWDGIEYMFLDYNSFDFQELKNNLTGKLVYVGDFSFKTGHLEELEEVVEDIITVDHHKGVYDDAVADKDNVHVDLTKSGALLAWEFFFGIDIRAPFIIALISDRDLWNFFYGLESKALYLLIKKEGHDQIMQYMSEDEEVSIVQLKDDLEKYIEEVVSLEKSYIKRAEQAIPYTLLNTNLHGINLTSTVSDILNVVSKIKDTPSFAYWFDNELDAMQFSFRNHKDDVHVNLLAKVIGGDGHVQASGSRVNIGQLNLNAFFVNKIIEVWLTVGNNETSMLFHKHGVSVIDVVSLANCRRVMENEGLSFHDLFEVKRDTNQDLVIYKK